MKPTLKICFAASEVAPFAKTGGLADVAGALPVRLGRLGLDVRVFMPLYAGIDAGDAPFPTVDFARDVAVELGPHTYRFSARTTRLADSEVDLYLIDCPELYHRDRLYTADADEPRRFAMLSRAVIECCQRMAWSPDVFHCNDWHTALTPLLLKTIYDWDDLFRRSKTLLTIHNIGYQGAFPRSAVDDVGLEAWSHLLDQDDLHTGVFNFLRTGLIYTDAISTVSPRYSQEIQTDEYGMGLQQLLRTRRDRLVGILNGVDYEQWSPQSDRFIPHRFSPQDIAGKARNKAHLIDSLGLDAAPRAPLIGIVSRLTRQKGFDLCFDVLPDLFRRHDLRLVVVGAGEATYEQFFESLQDSFPGSVCYHRGYNEELAHMIEAASDMILMPSLYEPCGLNQMFGLKYGTLPIVRRTGGLADTVEQIGDRNGSGTGFVFDHFTAEGLGWALEQALRTYAEPDAWRGYMRNAMSRDFSWDTQSEHYVELYSRLANEP